jgi:predicted TIM-barrel fold metal-dependent hydrolase
MIVDVHTRVWRREHWPDELTREVQRARTSPAGFSSVVREVTEEAYRQALESADRAIVFGLRARHVGLLVPNDFVADFVRRFPEKLIGFASVDPNEPAYLDELHRAVEDLGLRGVKLGPVYQNVHPMDKRMRAVYEYAERNRLPILIHQGTTFAWRAPLRLASPLLLDEIALAYPDLVMIIAHLGHPWIPETIILIRKHPNLYADISALFYRPWQFYTGLRLALDYGVMEKLLFGSDYPFATPEETIEGIREIARLAAQWGAPLPEEAVIGLLERDALRLLGLV